MNKKLVVRLAGLEVNALVKAGMLPLEDLKGARISEIGPPIKDIDGETLFYRVPIVRRGQPQAYADLADNPIFGSPLLAVHLRMPWDPQEYIKKAEAAAKKEIRGFMYDRVEFVAFSYP